MALYGLVGGSTIESGVAGTPPTFTAGGTEILRGCRAFVNFAGASGTINSSFNVSSVTRNAVADYTLNFTSALADATYAVSVNCSMGMNNSGSSSGVKSATQYGAPALKTTTQVEVFSCIDYTNGAHDPGEVYVSIFR